MSAVITGTHADTSATPATVAKKRTRIEELDASFSPLFDELSEVMLARKEAETREKELKAEILAAITGPTDKLETVVVKAGGAIRSKISMRSRTNLDGKKLLEAFPEAYSAVSAESSYSVVSPA